MAEQPNESGYIGVTLTAEQLAQYDEGCKRRDIPKSAQARWLIERLLRGEIPWGPLEPQAQEDSG